MHEDRVAVVTGAAQGIGRAIAEKLAQNGLRVALTDVRGEAVKQSATEIAAVTGVDVRGYVADVTDASAVDKSIEAIQEDFGSIHVLVNNAGIITANYDLIEDVTEADFDRMLATHVKGSFLCTKSTLPVMKKQQYGRIFVVSSLVGPLGFIRRVGYSTAKAGVLGLMRSIAAEAGKYGVTANSINPGYIMTPTIAERIASGVLDEQSLLNRVPLRRWGRSSDVAGVINAMISPDFDYVTGAEVMVDGGYRIQGDYALGDDD